MYLRSSTFASSRGLHFSFHASASFPKQSKKMRMRLSTAVCQIQHMVLELTQPITETSTRNLPGGKGRPARKADNLTAICEPSV
jgi:hypothetical protein